ncbi:MAG: hypothetical protein M3327_11380, partial [Actinomycetota bacterium]|nr:hypothetical protein [Actinomycetota bacterium]
AERRASAASMEASAVEAAIERGADDPLAAVERERDERDRRIAADREERVQAIIRNPLLLAQSPHLREEVERRRPDILREREERDRLAELHLEARGHGHRAREGEVPERFR